MQKIWKVAGQPRHFDESNVARSRKKKEGISVKDYADVPRVPSLTVHPFAGMCLGYECIFTS